MMLARDTNVGTSAERLEGMNAVLSFGIGLAEVIVGLKADISGNGATAQNLADVAYGLNECIELGQYLAEGELVQLLLATRAVLMFGAGGTDLVVGLNA